LKDCDEAIRLQPSGNWYALSRRGLVYFLMGQNEKAIADYNAAMKIKPNNSNVLFGRGLAKFRMGNMVAGEADVASAKRLQANIVEYFARHGVK